MTDDMTRIADLLRERNRIDAEIAAITGRPMTSGHLGEWIAARIFGIDLESSASAAGIDGRFTSGDLAGKTVNVKWYLKREGLLDMSSSMALDYYLVLAGPAGAAGSSRGSTRPWLVEAVYLFDARRLREEQATRGVKSGTAASVLAAQWLAAEVYPAASARLPLTGEQAALLSLLGGRRL
jgi:hypothetical protein